MREVEVGSQGHGLKNKVVMITGGTHGIGRVVVKELANLGATVYVVCLGRTANERNEAIAAVDEIKTSTGNNGLSILFADISSKESVKEAAEEFLATGSPLHVLINNAGVFGIRKRKLTIDGLEYNFGTNYYGHFLLTMLLLDRIKSSGPSRIINVTSGAYAQSPFDTKKIYAEEDYHFRGQYSFSKLCVILFTKELARRLTGTDVTVNCLYPGLVWTGISRQAGLFYNLCLFYRARNHTQSPEVAAKTYLYLCDQEMAGVTGKCFFDCKEAPLNKEASSLENASVLWDVSMKLAKGMLTRGDMQAEAPRPEIL